MIVVDQLAQSYHWSMSAVKALTMPQLIMLNHAAWVNSKRGSSSTTNEDSADDPMVEVNGKRKRFSTLTDTEKDAYYGVW